MNNKKYFNKKGMSDIVATLIIILLVVVAAGIIWVVVRNVVLAGSGDIHIHDQLTQLEIRSASLTGGNLNVVLFRGSGGEDNIHGIRFIFFDGSNSDIIKKEHSMKIAETRTFSFASDDFSIIDDINNIASIEIAAIYSLTGGDKLTGRVLYKYVIGEGGFSTLPPSDPGEQQPGENGEGAPVGGDCSSDEDCASGLECSEELFECIEPVQAGDSCEEDEECIGRGYFCVGGECICNEDLTCADFENYECGNITICGIEYVCGSCEGFGKYCKSNQCLDDEIINSGSVQDVFPSDNPFAFFSQDLPFFADNYLKDKYINFSGINDCFKIGSHVYFIDPETFIVYNYLSFENLISGLTIGKTYSVWNHTECGGYFSSE